MTGSTYGLAALGICAVIYVVVSLRRFPTVKEEDLHDHRQLADARMSPAWAFAVVAFFLGTGFLGIRGGFAALTVALWASFFIVPLVWFCFRQSRSSPCEICGLPMQTARKKPRESVPALVYVQLCPSCKTYREHMVISIGGGN